MHSRIVFMKHFKNTLLALTIFTSAQIFGAQAPIKHSQVHSAHTSTNYFSQLPAELRGEVLQYAFMGSGYPDVKALANAITAMQSKLTVDSLLKIFESLNTTNALALAEQLHHIPLMQDPRIAAWVATEKTHLINGPALFNAAAKGNVELVKNLLTNKYSNVNWRNTGRGQDQGHTPLLRVVSLAHPEHIVAEIVDMLLKAGANPNLASQTKIKQVTHEDWTALMAAAGKGNERVVEMLVRAKANVNAQDVYGDTALIEATKKGHTEIVQILRDAGAQK